MNVAGPSSGSSTSPASSSTDKVKRPKISRACDACREKKLRCIYSEIAQRLPAAVRRCIRCEKLDISCESVQPAKMDRRRLDELVRRVKTDEDRLSILQKVTEKGVYTTSVDRNTVRKRPRASSTRPPQELLQTLQNGNFPTEESLLNVPTINEILDMDNPPPVFKLTAVEPRMQGSTAAISILEDVADDVAVTAHRKRYRVFHIGDDWVFTGYMNDPVTDDHLSTERSMADYKDTLLRKYQELIAPIYPVVAPGRVMEVAQSSNLITLAMVAAASLDRTFPASAYRDIRTAFRRAQKDYADKGSTFAQVQALLISGMSHELHGEANMEGGSIAWLHIGGAIRRVFDLGLHRLDPSHWQNDMYADRVRAWLGCIAQDRCYALAYGHPLAIDLRDCVNPLKWSKLLQTPDNTSNFQISLHHLCEIMGDILRTLYRPNAWSHCKDADINGLQQKLDTYVDDMPESVSFHGQSTTHQGGLLNLVLTCTEVVFFRPFIKPQRSLPAHITFRPRPSRWFTVVQRARSVMSWMDAQGDILLDCWLFTKVAIAYAALALYFHCLATNDPESLRSLGIARQFMRRWAQGHQTGRTDPYRTKLADLVSVIFEAASKSMEQSNRSSQSEEAPTFAHPPAPAHSATVMQRSVEESSVSDVVPLRDHTTGLNVMANAASTLTIPSSQSMTRIPSASGPSLLDFETIGDLSGALSTDMDFESLLGDILRHHTNPEPSMYPHEGFGEGSGV